jgi:curved DNA-binding protein CbpA
MNVPLTGDLRSCSLPRILIELNRGRATGTLLVTTPGFNKNIYVKDGSVIFASSSFEDDRLGEMLVKAGKITMEQYDKSVELLKKTGKRQGAILVDLGYITAKDLFWGVKYQVKEIIYSLFRLEDGTYEFNETASTPDEVITLKISTENLIYEGVQRIDNLTRIRREMPKSGSVFRLNEDPAGIFRGIDLSPQDTRILSLVDGKRTVNQLIEEAKTNSFDVMKTLYILWSTGFIVEKKAGDDYDGGETITVEEILGNVKEEEEELREKVDDLYQRLPDMTPAEILQATESTGANEIKKTYYRMAKEFHPDRIFGLEDDGLKKKVTVIFDALTKAYDTMKDEVKRAEFFDALGKVQRRGDDTEASLIEEQFKRGIDEFKKGDFWGAAELFRLVTRKSPKNPKSWSYLSLALSRIPNRLKEAEEALFEAIKLEPYSSEHLANLGLLYLKAGLKKRAQHQFEKALRLDPTNAKAKKGLEQAQ